MLRLRADVRMEELPVERSVAHALLALVSPPAPVSPRSAAGVRLRRLLLTQLSTHEMVSWPLEDSVALFAHAVFAEDPLPRGDAHSWWSTLHLRVVQHVRSARARRSIVSITCDCVEYSCCGEVLLAHETLPASLDDRPRRGGASRWGCSRVPTCVRAPHADD